MTNKRPGENKVLRTAEVASDLGVQPHVFLQLAAQAGAGFKYRLTHWSENRGPLQTGLPLRIFDELRRHLQG